MDSEKTLRRIKPDVHQALRAMFFGVPSLYLEDVEAIFDAMVEFSKRDRDAKMMEGILKRTGKPWYPVVIKTDEFEMNRVEEFGKLKRKNLRTLTMLTDSLNVYLLIHPMFVLVSTNRDDRTSKIAFEQVTKVVKARQNFFISKIMSIPGVAGSIVVALIVGIAASTVSDGSVSIGMSAIFVLAVYVLTLAFWHRRDAVVIPRYKMDVPTFFDRNRDALFITLIGGAILLAIELYFVL